MLTFESISTFQANNSLRNIWHIKQQMVVIAVETYVGHLIAYMWATNMGHLIVVETYVGYLIPVQTYMGRLANSSRNICVHLHGLSNSGRNTRGPPNTSANIYGFLANSSRNIRETHETANSSNSCRTIRGPPSGIYVGHLHGPLLLACGGIESMAWHPCLLIG